MGAEFFFVDGQKDRYDEACRFSHLFLRTATKKDMTYILHLSLFYGLNKLEIYVGSADSVYIASFCLLI
jgi:hypothetical protein